MENYSLLQRDDEAESRLRTRWCFVDFILLEIKQVVNDSKEKTDRTGVRISPAPQKNDGFEMLIDIYIKG